MVDPRLLENIEKLFSYLRNRSQSSRIGSLISGIAHNLNGSIQILSMQIEMLQGMIAANGGKDLPAIQHKIDQCLSQVEKMKSILEGLTSEGHSDDLLTLQKIHLNEVLERTLGLFYHHLFFKHHINVKKNFSSRMPLIQGYEIDFSESFANLIENAAEAMEATPEKHLEITTRANNDSIQVVFTDTGCGVPLELRPHLFQPFFTTKDGSHFGLGLFMTRYLLTPYGAVIEPHFRNGETFFSVKIPLTPPSDFKRR